MAPRVGRATGAAKRKGCPPASLVDRLGPSASQRPSGAHPTPARPCRAGSGSAHYGAIWGAFALPLHCRRRRQWCQPIGWRDIPTHDAKACHEGRLQQGRCPPPRCSGPSGAFSLSPVATLKASGRGTSFSRPLAGFGFRLRRGPNREHVKIYRLFYYRSDKISDLNLSFFLF